jgi:hypothetical protein
MDGIFCCTALKKSDKIDKWLKQIIPIAELKLEEEQTGKRQPYDQ